MTSAQVKRLRFGDEVFWNDPDGGLCSRVYRIHAIELCRDNPKVVRITDIDGDVLECFIKELQ